MSGTTDKIKGAAKELSGKATGDRQLETEGKTDQVKGDVKNVARDVKDSVKGVDRSLDKH
jgi:uncharacterized protein YjbJ (UPF0337 family)